MQAEIDAIVKRIKPHGEDIRKKAEEGDNLCRNIVGVYKLLPEPGALGVLEASMDIYERRIKEEGDLKFISMKIVNTILEMACTDVDTRQKIKDDCDLFVMGELKSLVS